MEAIYRVLLWTLVFCHCTRSQEESCNNKLGMESKRIPHENITASSSKGADRAPHFARVDGPKAWCSAPDDNSPYIQIELLELKLITAITTQGSSSDVAWVRKYRIKYLEKGNWKDYDEELTGNENSRALMPNDLEPPIRTQKIRIYPKEPFSMMLDPTNPIPCCLRLELHGCSAAADCKDPGHPLNGRRNGNDFGHGKQITFECMGGFMLVGSTTAVCHKGTWSHTLPQCKATCKDPGVPVNGKRKGVTFIDGDSVEFTCDENYSLIGSSISRCLGGRWTSALPECKASCPDPGIPVNGERVGSSFGHGKHLQFKCRSGYWLVGSQLIVCNEGKWSNDIPTCRAVCSDPGVPENGVRIGDDFGDGQMVAYRCNENFNLMGSSTSFCVAGHWNTTVPTCKASCSDPGVPRHGRRIGSNFAHGAKVTFVCFQDFSLLGSQSMTCHDGKWSSVVPICKASCKDPGSPRNGVRHGNEFGHNKRISFTCLPGFQLTGTPNAVCINGKWSASMPQCKAVCLDPGEPVHGSRIGNNFLDGQTVAFSCQPGHTLIGSQVLRCVAGKWNKPIPECKASCPDPVAPLNGRVVDLKPGNRHGERVRFVCDSGFKLKGPSAIRCNDGIWNEAAPLCIDIDECVEGLSGCDANAVCTNTIGSFTCKCNAGSVGNGKTCFKSCNDPGAPQNGQRRGSDFRHGRKVTFICQADFKIFGSGAITCRNGTWSGKVPVCMANCRNPGIPRNGVRRGNNFEHGQKVSFTCNSGYTLIGSKAMECQKGVWSSPLPQCKKSCTDPGNPTNGRRVGRDFRHGMEVRFVCRPSFKLTGVSSITCRDGAWSDKVPVCTESCRNPGVPLNGARKGDNFQHGQTVSFSCNSGYTLIGSKAMECQKGVWSSPLPQCKKSCSDPGNPQNGRRIGRDFRHGRRVSFVCQPNYQLRGMRSIVCHDGAWSGIVPVCRAVCKIPARLNNGVISANKFDNEGMIEFTCHLGYKLIGSSVLRCVGGQWNDSIPSCQKDSCPSPPVLAHGSHNGNDYSNGRNVTYSCDPQYALEGSTVIACLDGQWIGEVPVCRAPCQPPAQPVNGFVFGGNLHQSTVQFWCDDEFVLRGSSFSQCNDGSWDSPVPVCEVTCVAPVNISHGSYSGSNHAAGNSVTYSCDDQYFLDGLSVITCVDGRWNGTPPICRAPCSPPVPPVNGFAFGDNHQHHAAVQFWCDEGYTLRGSAFSQCFDGKWDTRAPYCEAPSNSKSCRKPPLPPNAVLLSSQAQREWFSDGERVYYQCKPGYSRSGFSIQRCRNGQWTKQTFKCQPRSCGHPGTPINGRINGYVFTYNSTIEYSCRQGYTLVGSKTRLCQANQTWSGTLPQCTTVNCGPIDAPLNGEKVVEASTFLDGKVTFRCIGIQYKLVGPSTRTCLSSGQWSGTQPSCDLIVCDDPGRPENGGRTINRGLYYSGSVRFNCNRKYRLDGALIIYCTKDGTWSKPAPKCLAPCTNPGTPKHGRRSASDFRHNRPVRFYCKKNFRLVGSKEITCNNGQWSGAVPTCQKKKKKNLSP